MSNLEISTGWRSVLTNDLVYRLTQTVFSERRSKQLILDEMIFPALEDATSSCVVLDIGCGPGNLARFLPDGVSYLGFDPDAGYIRSAKERYSQRPETTFFVSTASSALDNPELPDESIDVAIVHGVLHHVSDLIAQEIFELARRKLKPNGRMLVLEPVFFEGQSKWRRFVMGLDRGKNIKPSDEWDALVDDGVGKWAQWRVAIEPKLISHYDLVVYRIQKDPART